MSDQERIAFLKHGIHNVISKLREEVVGPGEYYSGLESGRQTGADLLEELLIQYHEKTKVDLSPVSYGPYRYAGYNFYFNGVEWEARNEKGLKLAVSTFSNDKFQNLISQGKAFLVETTN